MTHSAQPLLTALQTIVLPAMSGDIRRRLVIARTYSKQLELPAGVEIVVKRRSGKRVAVRTSGLFERATNLAGCWPVDGLRELRVPKLAFVIAGTAGFRVADYVLRCPTGTAILLPPGTPHADGLKPHNETLDKDWNGCSLLWLTPLISGLGCRVCHSYGETHTGSRVGERAFLHNPRLLQLFTLLCEEVDDRQELSAQPAKTLSPVFEHLLAGFLHALERDLREEQFILQGDPISSFHQLQTNNPIAQAEQHIRSNFRHAVTIDDVARLVFMSRAQFTRKFRQHTGQSFLQYLTARRLEHACLLLKETEWTAAMIGQTAGFRSATHFHRAFLQAQQISPMEYRRQCRKE